MPERSLSFGSNAELVGTLCLPEQQASSAPGVVLFNAGLLHRVGPHRVQVRLARALAARGQPSLRFDLHGLGDSARASGALGHGAQALADLRDALEALREHADVDRFAVLGFCSGIVPAFRLAEADSRVRVLALYDGFDLLNSISRLRYYLGRLLEHGLDRTAMAHYLRRARLTWGALMLRLRDVSSTGASGSDADDLSVPALLAGLAALNASGVQVSLINAGSAFGVRDGQAQMRAALDRHGARDVRAVFLDDVDHLLTSLAAQRTFIDAACAALGAPAPSAAA